MEKLNVKINYLYNSGFVIETKNYLLIFDYYMDSVDNGDKNLLNGVISVDTLKLEKHILVFASHGHGDHYNPVIFEWKKVRNDIRYILSSDIKIAEDDENINVMSAYEKLMLEDVYIKAFGSTDIGVSFLVNVDGINIFHAGDLNWWYWHDDTETEIKAAEIQFKEEIEKLKGVCIDIAFFPVDPRLEHNYYLGAEYFINEINPEILIPMHFREGFETTRKFAEKTINLPTRTIEITHRGQEILI